MKKCNVCNRNRPEWFYKTDKKKTCRRCEYNWWRDLLRMMVRDRRLTPIERLASRAGYMGTGPCCITVEWPNSLDNSFLYKLIFFKVIRHNTIHST